MKKVTEAEKESRHVKCDPQKRRITLLGRITPITRILIERAVNRILSRGKIRTIELVLSSRGGDFYAILDIFHFLALCRVKIHTIVSDRAHSGALLIFQVGHRRFMFADAVLKFHRTTKNIESADYNAEELGKIVSALQEIDAMQLLILTRKGRPVKKIFDLFDKDAEISSQEALDLHLADEIIKPREQ